MAAFPMPNDWQVGQIINNRYEVRDLLGEGGMGKVYKVYCQDWQRDMAVKRPKPSIFTKVFGKEEFIREAEAWVKLSRHPHIVSCHFVETIASVPSIFVEYIDGGSLADWIERKESLLYRGNPTVILGRILDLAIQLAWGLDHAHTQGLIHQDIKPANVLLTQEGTARITDFGLAQARFLGGEINLSRRADASVAVEGVGMMTVAYASPEQAEGKYLTRSTDLWSWAVSVLDLFVGSVARGYGPASAEALEKYLREGPADPTLPPMPPEVATLLRQCFQPNPAARPASMQKVATTLQMYYAEVVGTSYVRPAPQAAVVSVSNLGNSLMALGKPEEALDAYEQVLRLNAQDAITWMNKGGALHALKRDEEALAADEQSLRLNPQYAPIWRNKSLLLHDLRRYEEALAASEQALSLDPQNAHSWSNKGDVLRELQRAEEALAAYEQALCLDPQDARIWMDKGVALYDLGRYEEALATYERALRLDPLDARTWMNKGVALCACQRYKEALVSYKEALRLDPKLTDAWMDKGNALYDLQWYEEALAAYKEALRLDPQDAPIWMNKGNTLYRLGQNKEALVAYEQALRLNPDLTDAWGNKGNALRELRRDEEALAAYEQALRLDPNMTNVWKNKGEVLYDLRRDEEALAAYEQARRLNLQDVLIEVPNRWGQGDNTPLVVEQHPDLERIFTDPHPPLPQRLTKNNTKFWEGMSPLYVRQVLAVAYLLHPDPKVRLATLRLTKDVWGALPQNLVDALADPSQDVRVAAAQVIWDLSPDAKLESKVTFALACLRDEIEGTGFTSTLTQAEAQQGLEVLRDCRPDRRADFNRLILAAWCRRDENLTNHGYSLLDIYGQQGSFLGAAEEETRRIGRTLENTQERHMIYRGIRQAIGASAAQELEEVWDGGRKPFNRVEPRNVMEAIDILFDKALSSIQATTPSTIGTIYEDLKKHWNSQALYYGTPTQIREIVSHNLELLVRWADFNRFSIDIGKEDGADASYAQVNALYKRTFIGIRLWRSPGYLFVCGNADFEGPQEAVCEANSLQGMQPGIEITHYRLGDKDSLLRGGKVGSLDFIENLVMRHIGRLQRGHADEVPASQWDIFLRPDILDFTLHSIARQIPLSVQDARHTYRGQQFSNAIVVVSVVPALKPSHAMAYFPKGYMEAFVALMNAYQFDLKGSSAFIHWIYCFDDHAGMVHLTFDPGASEARKVRLIARDLLSKEEKQRWFQDFPHTQQTPTPSSPPLVKLLAAQRQPGSPVKQQAEHLSRFEGKESFMLCDVCNTQTSLEKGTIYSAQQFRFLVSQGFERADTNPAVLLATQIGISKSEMMVKWKRQVAEDRTDWLLCPACAARAATYRGSSRNLVEETSPALPGLQKEPAAGADRGDSMPLLPGSFQPDSSEIPYSKPTDKKWWQFWK